jgi:hypothetical protein
MTTNLIEKLRQIEDFRTLDGRRHPLWLVLLFVIMGTMSGYVGDRGWGDFVKRHRRELGSKMSFSMKIVQRFLRVMLPRISPLCERSPSICCAAMVMIPSQQGRDFSPMSLTNSSVLWNETALPSGGIGRQAPLAFNGCDPCFPVGKHFTNHLGSLY